MSSPKSILVVIDPTRDEQPALQRALQIAKPGETQLTLLVCVYNSSLIVDHLLSVKATEFAKETFLRKKEEWLDGLLEQHNVDYAELEKLVIWHKPLYEGVIQVAERIQPDLVIKASHTHAKLSHFLFSSNDWQLLKSCAFPLLMVKSSRWTPGKSVLAAVDPDHELNAAHHLDDSVIKHARTMSEYLDEPLSVVHCFDSSAFDLLSEYSTVGMYGEMAIPKQYENIEQVQQQREADLTKKITDSLKQQGLDEELGHVVRGQVEEELLNAVHTFNAGVLVMGTTYRTGLLGSTAENLLDQVDCDVLAVKYEGFETP